VKIKITEYFPGAGRQVGEELGGGGIETTANNNLLPSELSGGMIPQQGPGRVFGMLGSNDGGPADVPGSDGRRYYTIQRVNGNGGNGKFDGTAGPHKHSLEESDRVKKNSVLRCLLLEEKAKKKSQVSNSLQAKSARRERRSEILTRVMKTPRHCIIASSHRRIICLPVQKLSVCHHPLPVFCFHTQSEEFLQPDRLYIPIDGV
jgi:hypothetical protein